MKSCTSCPLYDDCVEPCVRVESLISPAWSTRLKEMAWGSFVELTPSSAAFKPDNTPFPDFSELRPIEAKILEYCYQDGYSYKKIAKKLCKKQNYVKITIQRAKAKIKASQES